MAKFDEVYFKEQNLFITIDEHIDKIHRDKIYCPECRIAKVHKVADNFFRTNRSSIHKENCSLKKEIISNRELRKIIKEKKSLVQNLIDNSLNSSIRLLQDIDSNEIKEENSINFSENNTHKNSTLSEAKYQKRINTVSINSIYKRKEELKNNYITIYGKVNIEVTVKDKFETIKFKSLRNNNYFSVYFNENQKNYLEDDIQSATKIAIFGEFKLNVKNNKEYLNLNIRTTKDMRLMY